MLEAGIHPTSYTYTTLLRTLCKRDVEVQKTIAMLHRQSVRYGTEPENLSQLESEMNIENALAIFETAVRTGWAQDFETELYNQLLRTLSHYGNTEDALYVFAQLENSTKSMPNSGTYASLITLYGRAGDLQGALECFQEYSECKDSLGSHDASYVYNALVDAHLKCGDVPGALKVIEKDMVQDGIKVTTIPYNSVTRDTCNRANYQDAHDLISRMESDDDLPQPDASTYGPILSAMCHQSDYDASCRLYNAMIKTDISKSYGNMANFAFLCLSSGHAEKVFDIISDMRAVGLEPDVTLCERFVTYFTVKNDISSSIEALKTITTAVAQKSFIKSTIHISSPALQLLDRCSSLSEALSVIHIVSPFGIRISPKSAGTVLELYAHEDSDQLDLSHKDFSALLELALTAENDPSSFQETVFRIFHNMQALDLKPNKMLCSRIYQILVKNGDEELAAEWRRKTDKFIEGRMSPDLVRRRSSTLSIEADVQSNEITKAAIRGKFDEAVQILQHSIIDQDMIPTPEAIRDTIVLVAKQGNMDIAVQIYQLAMDAYRKFEDDDKIKRAKHMALNSVLIGYAQLGDMVEAKKYYQDSKLKRIVCLKSLVFFY
jgi:pentatricopeptide repeat protein